MLVTTREELAEDALLMAILGVIFMSGGSLTEKSMWNFIERLGYERDRVYMVFGGLDTIKTIVSTNFVRYGFIEISKIPVRKMGTLLSSTVLPSFTSEFGPRGISGDVGCPSES